MFRFVFVVLLCICNVKQSLALPSECLQAPERIKSCPHLIYKKALVAVPVINVKKNTVVCICLTDLPYIKKSNKSELEQIDQQVSLERMARKYQISQADLVKLVKQ